MSRIALLEPPYADQTGTLLARRMPGDVPPIGLFRMFAQEPPDGWRHARTGAPSVAPGTPWAAPSAA